MATISDLCAAAGVGLALCAVTPTCVQMLPQPWTHTLAPASCVWSVRPWARRLGAAEIPRDTPPISRATWECRQARGARMRVSIPVLNTLLRRWPSRAELAALSRQDTEDENPLPAQGSAAAGDVRSDHPGRG